MKLTYDIYTYTGGQQWDYETNPSQIKQIPIPYAHCQSSLNHGDEYDYKVSYKTYWHNWILYYKDEKVVRIHHSFEQNKKLMYLEDRKIPCITLPK